MSKKDIPYFLVAIAFAVALVTINYREEPARQEFNFQQAVLDRLDQMNQIEFMQTFR
jgi:hypothetical protein